MARRSKSRTILATLVQCALWLYKLGGLYWPFIHIHTTSCTHIMHIHTLQDWLVIGQLTHTKQRLETGLTLGVSIRGVNSRFKESYAKVVF